MPRLRFEVSRPLQPGCPNPGAAGAFGLDTHQAAIMPGL
jgi:hypothetical protein